jgi:hypothetical protein
MDYIRKNRFLLFLVCLLAIIVYPIFIRGMRGQNLISTIIFSLILLSGMYAFSQERRFLRITGAFFFIAILLEWLQFILSDTVLDILQPLVTSLVLVLLLVLTMKSIRATREVTQNVIFGVIAGYILIGFIGGLLVLSIGRSIPDAFHTADPMSAPQAIYFSFVTMTTLGYGDILPHADEARSLSVLLSIVGPMYVAVVIAFMIGKFAARNKS